MPYQKVKLNVANSHDFVYTSFTNIPKTNFSCCGKKGMFADVETKCQVNEFFYKNDGIEWKAKTGNYLNRQNRMTLIKVEL